MAKKNCYDVPLRPREEAREEAIAPFTDVIVFFFVAELLALGSCVVLQNRQDSTYTFQHLKDRNNVKATAKSQEAIRTNIYYSNKRYHHYFKK